MSTIPNPTEPPTTSTIPPQVAASQAAFRRLLPELLVQRPRQWVAFHGDELIGFARTETELYQICLKRGLTEEQFVVRFIQPEADPETDYTFLFND